MAMSNKRRHHQLFPRFSPTAIFTDEPTPTPTIIIPIDPNKPIKIPRPIDPLPPPDTTDAATTTSDTIPPVPTTTDTPTTTSTSDTPTPTTTSTTSIAPPTVVPPPVMPTTSVVIQTTSLPPVSTSAANAAASTSAAASGGLNTGAVVGCIAGGLAAVAFAVVVCVYFLRRWRKQHDEEEEFNANAFRRSAVLVEDSASGYGGYGGRNPRPPTMIERKIANVPPSVDRQAAGFGNQHYAPEYEQEYAQQQYAVPPGAHAAHDIGRSFSPGQVIPTSPTTPLTNPFQSPIISIYDTSHPPNDQLANQPPVAVSGQDSYVDMSRSSVTPYQAAQYAEINRQLQPVITEEEERHSMMATPSAQDFPAVPVTIHQPEPTPRSPVNQDRASPFADPQSEDNHRHSVELNINLEPPSPSYSRITSTPPMLPEITPTQRTFSAISPASYDFPISAGPSPYANSFMIPARESSQAASSPFANQTTEEQPSTPNVVPAKGDTGKKADGKSKRPDTMCTVYGPEEDAYGGI